MEQKKSQKLENAVKDNLVCTKIIDSMSTNDNDVVWLFRK